MAIAQFSNIANLAPVNLAGPQIVISVGLGTQADATGVIKKVPQWFDIDLRAPVDATGDLPLLRIAVASTASDWKTKLDELKQWPNGIFTLDNVDGWTVQYDCDRLLVDHWDLVPSATGAGYEEHLILRAFVVDRTRFQTVTLLDLNGIRG